ncbi:hypothetical protein OG211_26570 [Streptomyces niveus]|uniref:hypothetical protein n=1 Tax=Streptomyces niveus TaxID=193462 RepID=UPI00386AFC67|nr:hypothetical protein OG211_26570 [Streptomyces niveus]
MTDLRALRLYARTRAAPATLAVLAATALGAAWAAQRLSVIVLAPLFAAGVVGTGLFTHSAELERGAVRPWWPRRLAHLLLATALAAMLLALAVPGRFDAYGASAMARNVIGSTGVAAASAVVIGARLSWLPMMVCTAVTSLLGATDPADGGVAAAWAWQFRPEDDVRAWLTALAIFGCGASLHACRGTRPDNGG